jgi:hypothetical protein
MQTNFSIFEAPCEFLHFAKCSCKYTRILIRSFYNLGTSLKKKKKTKHKPSSSFAPKNLGT